MAGWSARLLHGDLSLKLPRVKAEPWPEADRIFHADPRWRGGDDAYSVPLGGSRVLWLFGDSFIGGANRRESAFIRNSVAVQEGLDPLTASMTYAWAPGPASFFDEHGGDWFWPGHGAVIGDSLVVFMMQVRSTRPEPGGPIEDWRSEGPVGFFDAYTWESWVLDARDPVGGARRETLKPTVAKRGPMLSGGCLVEDGHLYAYSAGGHMMRVEGGAAAAGDLRHAEWTRGVLPGAGTEYSVHRDSTTGLLMQVQTVGFLGASIGVRWAERPEGPWSELVSVFQPEDARRPDGWIYAGKAHPHLECDGLAVTYASNGRTVDVTLDDESLYFPRFVRLKF